jgi:hypothetical protein
MDIASHEILDLFMKTVTSRFGEVERRLKALENPFEFAGLNHSDSDEDFKIEAQGQKKEEVTISGS